MFTTDFIFMNKNSVVKILDYGNTCLCFKMCLVVTKFAKLIFIHIVSGSLEHIEACVLALPLSIYSLKHL